MNAPAQDLIDAAQMVEITAPTAFAVRGEPYPLPSGMPLVEGLQQALYGFYSRGPAGRALGHARPTDPATARRFVGTLSQANGGRGTRAPGWKVVAIDEDGRVEVRKDGLSLWAGPGDFEAHGGEIRVGAIGRLRMGKELRALSPGFYFAIGNGLAPADDPAVPLVRYYWHVTAEGAAPLLGAITAALNNADVPFQLKVASDPQGYRRADPAVLYLGWEAHGRAVPVLAEVYPAVAGFLRPEVPRFTRALAPGLGVAEDPRVEGLSFGQHRCRLVADGLWTAFGRGHVTATAKAEEVAAAFVRHGLDPARPHLGAGSDREYASVVGPAFTAGVSS